MKHLEFLLTRYLKLFPYQVLINKSRFSEKSLLVKPDKILKYPLLNYIPTSHKLVQA